MRLNTTDEQSRRRMKWLTAAAVVALLAVFYVQAVTSVLQKSMTSDEIAHLTAGYVFWSTNDYRMHPENGQLPARVAALPLILFGNYTLPSTDQPVWWKSNIWQFGVQFMYELNDLQSLLWQGRAMIALMSLGIGVTVFFWSRRLFGNVGAFLSLILFSFSPTLLAHGRLVTSDAAVALFFLLALGAIWRILRKVTLWTLLAAIAALAGLMMSKMSGVIIIPVGLAMIAVRIFSRQPLPVGWFHEQCRVVSRWRRLAVISAAIFINVLAVWVIIWACYGFRFSPYKHPHPYGRDQLFPLTWEQATKPIGFIGQSILFARDRKLLPEAYLYGFAYTVTTSQARNAFLNGEYSVRGWWHFFPYCLAVKTPLGLFVLLGLSLLAWLVYLRRGRHAEDEPDHGPWRKVGQSFYRTAPLWIFLAVYWGMAVTSHLNIGARHLLPTYPIMFILIGGAAHWLGQKRRIAGALTILATLFFVIESVRIYPHYLEYFNQLVGGPKQGYRHLVDSSLDWGQDLPALSRWLKKNVSANTPVYLSLFGNDPHAYYGIAGENVVALFGNSMSLMQQANLPITPYRAGVYCISATMLQHIITRTPGPWNEIYESAYQQRKPMAEALSRACDNPAALKQMMADRGEAFWNDRLIEYEYLRVARLCAYLRQREPDDYAAYSILIYRLTDEHIRQALEGPPAEMAAPDAEER